MTVTLLKPYATFAQGASVDLDNTTEASLVAQGLAVYTSNPGPSFNPLSAAEQQTMRDQAPGVAGIFSAAAVSTDRYLLCSVGDSINSQDQTTTALIPSHNGVSPMLWFNALCCGAFDYIGPYAVSITPTAGTQTIARDFINGVWGYSGGLITDAIRYVIDQFITVAESQANGRKLAVLLGGGTNDFANVDTVDYHLTVWPIYQEIIEKFTVRGHHVIAKCGERSVFLNTPIKRRNAEAFAALVMTYAAANPTKCSALNVGDAIKKYGRGMTLERMTRGTTGDQVHPNIIGAVVYGLGYRDAVEGKFLFSPPWERSAFSGRVCGTERAITGLTQANPGVVTATSNGYVNTDQVQLLVVGGMTTVNGSFYSVASAAANTFALQDNGASPANVNTTAYPAYTSGGVSIRQDAFMRGILGTKGTGADAASVVPTGWTLVSFGTNTNNLSAVGAGAYGYGCFMDATVTGVNTADRVGLDLSVAPTVDTTSVFRGFVDFDLTQADYVDQLNFRIRTTGSTFESVGGVSSTDNRSMTADLPNAAKLLEGRRLVLSSWPFIFPASPSGALQNCGGAAGLQVTTLARMKTFTRFAGLIRAS